MEDKTKAAFYGRYSLKNEAAIESIKKQEKVCAELARLNNAIIVKSYVDYGVLANSERVQFNQMMEDAKNGLFNIIYVGTLDRFEQDKDRFEKYMNQLKQYNCELVSVAEILMAKF